MKAQLSVRSCSVWSAVLIACCTVGVDLRGQTQSQTPQPGQQLDPLTLGWPRFFATNGYEFAVYQPQIAAWPSNQLEGRFAVAVRPAGTSNETYGVVFFMARTEIDKVNRLVTMEDFQITRMDFPTQRGMQSIYETIIQGELPRAAKTIPLDHLEATYAVSAEVTKVKIQKVENTPPNFIYAMQPSLLVQVDGAPIQKPLVGNYQRVVNTRAVLLFNTNPINQGYYLYAASNWYSAPAITGPWVVNTFPPSNINAALAAAMATKQVDPAFPRAPLASPPAIYVVTTPTELLQSNGAANLLSVGGTDLLYVSNSDQAIFYYLDDANYYVLISGRWFKSMSLSGPWAYVASGSLPADFKKIPPDSPKSNVLLSVAGTPQAQEAVIASTIPQTATIYRDKATLAMEYVGAPSFVPIAGTTMFYAANTFTPVIMINAKTYYACENGVWFVAASATGPWAVALTVPTVIYTIPTSCPIHYVTYAYVYGYTPAVVYVGYTPGYMGVIVTAGGTVVYGTGYVYPAVVVGTTYVAPPPTYGSGASFALGAAVGFAFGYCAGHSSSCYYEPCWGAYHYPCPYPYHYGYAGYNSCSYSCYSHYGTAASSYGYNPYTGTEYRNSTASGYNPYTGTHGTASGSATYNPYSGQATANRSGSAYNPYTGASASGHASGSANVYSGNYNANRSVSGYNPSTGRSASSSANISGNAYNGNYNASRTVNSSDANTGTSVQNKTTVSGNAYNGTASVDRTGSAENSKTGNSASWNNGTMTTDKNGNTSTYDKGDTSANEATHQSAQSSSYSSAAQSSSAAKSGAYSGSGSSSSANREASAQATGSQRASSWQSSGGGSHSDGGDSWGGSHSGGWGGGGGGGGGWGGGGGGGFGGGGGGFGDSHSFGGGGGGGWGGGGHSWGGGGGRR